MPDRDAAYRQESLDNLVRRGIEPRHKVSLDALDALVAEIQRLRRALGEIAEHDEEVSPLISPQDLARAALKEVPRV